MTKASQWLRRLISIVALLAMVLQFGPPILSTASAQSPDGESQLSAERHSPDQDASVEAGGSVGLLRVSGTGEIFKAISTYRTTVSISGPYDWVRLDRCGVKILDQTEDCAVVLATEGQLEDLVRLRLNPKKTDALSKLLNVTGPQLRREVSLAQVALSSSVDDDADGLTNTQESWWGTDPMNPDSDSDGYTDGECDYCD